MLQGELAELAAAPVDRSLDRLEADIWHGLEARLAERHAHRGTVTLQLAILAVGMLGSVFVGHQWAATHTVVEDRGVFSPYTRLAASNLLVGERQ